MSWPFPHPRALPEDALERRLRELGRRMRRPGAGCDPHLLDDLRAIYPQGTGPWSDSGAPPPASHAAPGTRDGGTSAMPGRDAGRGASAHGPGRADQCRRARQEIAAARTRPTPR